ncbi:GNAT family N-acetyltransferase [Georgenia faecalis]|uniref:GNAT family N-acetyltransferase n=1 Tax=Georgenia faecalis TaxID=2483799 RepID=A0ABV9D9Y2_9MICO|nr:GNAT family N-acetyltransferase [Georgenia faecalis]
MQRHLFLRAHAHRWDEERAWETPDATLLRVRREGTAREPGRPAARVQLVGTGRPDALAELLVQAAADAGGPASAMLTRGTWALVPPEVRARYALVTGRGWDWMWSTTPPAPQPGEDRVAPMGTGREDEVRACLAVAYPETSADPGDQALAWWGYRDEDGLLRGVVAVHAPDDGGIHLSGLGTDQRWRRRGVASAMMAAVTRWGLTQRPYVHYGIWADNDAARRVYTRLGYRVGHEVENLAPEG